MSFSALQYGKSYLLKGKNIESHSPLKFWCSSELCSQLFSFLALRLSFINLVALVTMWVTSKSRPECLAGC